MRCGVYAALCAAIYLACTSVALAFAGKVDTENQFPYVVRVLSSFTYSAQTSHCSGIVVTRRMVLTETHCVWDSTAFADSISIEYHDTVGTSRTVPIAWFTHIIGYRSVSRLFDDSMSNTEWQNFIDQKVSDRIFHKMVSEDLTVLFPTEDIMLGKYAHLVTAPDLPFHRELSILRALGRGSVYWTPELVAQTAKQFNATFSPKTLARAIVVGYGQHDVTCHNMPGRASCMLDGKRRWGHVSLNAARTLEVDQGVHALGYRTDTSPESDGNPVLKGDSGGPLMVPDLTHPGDWVVIGLASARTEDSAWYTSLLYTTDLTNKFFESDRYRDVMKLTPTQAVSSRN